MSRWATVVVTVAALAAMTAPAVAAPDRARSVELGRQAYEYGLPLLEFVRVRAEQTSVRAPDARTNAPVNRFGHAARFAGPDSKIVVAPNVDTLYSIAHLDLGREPVVLSHPAMGSRFFDFELLDPYTNVVGYIGSRTTGARARRTAIVWSGRPGRVPRGVKVLRVPYRRIWIIGRTLVRTPSDMSAARRLMRRYSLVPLSRLKNPPKPSSRKPGTPKPAALPEGLEFFDALAAALAQNPPPRRDGAILARLAEVGIAPGRGPTRAGSRRRCARGWPRAIGWPRRTSPLEPGPRRSPGRWPQGAGTRRTPASAPTGPTTGCVPRSPWPAWANTPEEAMYPIALSDSEGRLLDGSHRYTVTFAPGQTPPVRAFWSLTMYTLDGFLVANPDRVYVLGDTHPPLVKRPDGSVVIAVQQSRPADATVNWLPTPSGGFRLNLRLYWPHRTALNGAWKPPPVIRLP